VAVWLGVGARYVWLRYW